MVDFKSERPVGEVGVEGGVVFVVIAPDGGCEVLNWRLERMGGRDVRA